MSFVQCDVGVRKEQHTTVSQGKVGINNLDIAGRRLGGLSKFSVVFIYGVLL